MPAPSSQVAGRMAALVSNFTSAERDGINAASLQAKNIQLQELRAVTGDLRMSGVGTKGARVGARYDMLSLGKGSVVYATGPVHLLERPSKPHEITTRRAKGRRRRGVTAKALGLPGQPYAKVQHPGVRNPRRPWARGFMRAKPVVDRTIRQQYGSAFARSMGGGR